MKRRGAMAGLCMLCALMLSAIAVQGASAAGTTAVTCEPTAIAGGTGTHADAHCKTKETGGAFKHVEFGTNTKTTVTLSNILIGEERSVGLLKATVGGFGIFVQAKKAMGTGTMENKAEGAEMWAEGSTEKIVFEEVTVTNPLGCSFNGLPGGAGKLETKPIRATTKGQGDLLKFEPSGGGALAEFEIVGAECPAAVKGKYPLFGSLRCVPEGATCKFSHNEITTAKTLRLKNATEGPLAGIEGSITLSAKDPTNEVTGEWPISTTTFP